MSLTKKDQKRAQIVIRNQRVKAHQTPRQSPENVTTHHPQPRCLHTFFETSSQFSPGPPLIRHRPGPPSPRLRRGRRAGPGWMWVGPLSPAFAFPSPLPSPIGSDVRYCLTDHPTPLFGAPGKTMRFRWLKGVAKHKKKSPHFCGLLWSGRRDLNPRRQPWQCTRQPVLSLRNKRRKCPLWRFANSAFWPEETRIEPGSTNVQVIPRVIPSRRENRRVIPTSSELDFSMRGSLGGVSDHGHSWSAPANSVARNRCISSRLGNST